MRDPRWGVFMDCRVVDEREPQQKKKKNDG
jgi:hypothetical protein